MCKHNASRLPCLLCEHSGTTLASFAGVGPSALPASLRGHPIWGCLAAEERSAYERDCMVADAHRAQLKKTFPALAERKKDCPSGKFLPADLLKAIDHRVKHGPKGKIPAGPGVSLVMRWTGLSDEPPREQKPAPALCVPAGERKLVRKKGYANLRQQVRG